MRVEAGDDGQPAAVHLSNRRFAVEEVLETWRIDDEWWRERPVRRMYFRLLLEGGRLVTVCQDLLRGSWFEQAYAY